MEYPGKFIVFEGIDGAGKTTQIAELAQRLTVEGKDVVLVREPGGTEISEQIRGLLKDSDNFSMTPMCELFLLEASRAQLVEEKIIPALERGAYVLCDRYTASTYAYQVGGRGIQPDIVNDLNAYATNNLIPDLEIFLSYPPCRLSMRKKDEHDRIVNSLNLYDVENGYHDYYNNHNAVLIFSTTIEETADRVYKAVNRLISETR